MTQQTAMQMKETFKQKFTTSFDSGKVKMDMQQKVECVKLYYSNNCSTAVTLRAYKTANNVSCTFIPYTP